MVTRVVGLTIVVVLAAAPLLWGATQARVSGTVTDSAEQSIANATITITSTELQAFTKVITTDKKGRYKVLLLDATKKYNFQVEADDFAPHNEPVKVGIGTMDNVIDVALKSQEEALEAQQNQLYEQPGYKELDEGFDLLKQGQMAEGRAKLEIAVEVLPDLIQGWTALAEVNYDMGDYQAAYDNALRCLELDEESTPCIAVAANSANKLGLTAEHAELMDRFEALNPDDPATIFNDAVPFLNAMDDEQARPILEKCLAADPAFPKCLYEYGMLLLRSGDMEGAKTYLESFLEVASEGPDLATATETLKYL